MNRRNEVLAWIALVAFAAAAALAFAIAFTAMSSGHSQPSAQRCFPATKWGPLPDKWRPCVEIVRVFEDGSFRYRVSDAGGAERYTGGVGALDR